MASVTGTASPDPELKPEAVSGASSETRRRAERTSGQPLGSRLGRAIVLLNLIGLAVLILGAFISNGLREGLIQQRLDSLVLQGSLIANVIDQTATQGEPEPALDADIASNVLQSLFIPRSQRARLYDAGGRLLADSFVVADRVESHPLPPPRRPGSFDLSLHLGPSPEQLRQAARAALAREVHRAAQGLVTADVRRDENGRRVVSVSIPIEHVRAVLGVLTLEAGDVEQIVAAERRTLIPFIVVAVGVTLLSSLMLTQLVAVPVLRLARAADRVRLSRARAIALPDLAGRRDELGDLARSLEAMTRALSDRMEAIERFAADVAHELRNPMTSIRSAVETLDLVKDAAPRKRLLAILQQDVDRMERLITDISNASRLDAELQRDSPTPLDVSRLLADICGFYAATAKPNQAAVVFHEPRSGGSFHIQGREGPLSQVFRNLIDNARSFSAPGGTVDVRVVRQGDEAVVEVLDRGPGIPADNLETVFQRFYTSRPKGAAFGGNSGLGLAIAKQIVEAHGGRIWADNREGGGARFTVALPLA